MMKGEYPEYDGIGYAPEPGGLIDASVPLLVTLATGLMFFGMGYGIWDSYRENKLMKQQQYVDSSRVEIKPADLNNDGKLEETILQIDGNDYILKKTGDEAILLEYKNESGSAEVDDTICFPIF